jgi:hypothetical protein
VSLTVGELAGLGDSLRVGPQWAWPTHQGTPIIQRGPHGQRFAPIPSESPGPGVRFWRESESPAFASAEWVPRPAVVGVMGLGAGLPELSEAGRNGLTKIARELVSELEAARGLKALEVVDQKARLAMETLGKYQAFEASWRPVLAGGWDSSQDVRASLQGVRANALRMARGGSAVDYSNRSPVAAGAAEFVVRTAPSGIPGVSVGDAVDGAVAVDRAATRAVDDALEAVGRAKDELERRAKAASDTAATAGKVLAVTAAVVIGAYALGNVAAFKQAFSPPARNPRKRRSAAARPASFRYE